MVHGSFLLQSRSPSLEGAERVCGFLLAALALFAFTGCSRDAPLHETSDPAFRSEAFDAAAGTRERALQALDSLDRGAMRTAFSSLDRLGYTRRLRTEALDETGRPTAFEEHVTRQSPAGDLRVLRSDSSGTFDFGWLGAFAETDVGAPAADLMQQVLPEEFSFLSSRNRHAFQYRLLADTTLASGPARVVAVRAQPGEDGDKQTVRQARLYLDRGTHQLVALRLHRANRSLLFDEDTRQYVQLRPAPSAATDAWVPAETRFETHMRMPLRATRRFRSSASYSAYRAS